MDVFDIGGKLPDIVAEEHGVVIDEQVEAEGPFVYDVRSGYPKSR